MIDHLALAGAARSRLWRVCLVAVFVAGFAAGLSWCDPDHGTCEYAAGVDVFTGDSVLEDAVTGDSTDLVEHPTCEYAIGCVELAAIHCARSLQCGGLDGADPLRWTECVRVASCADLAAGADPGELAAVLAVTPCEEFAR